MSDCCNLLHLHTKGSPFTWTNGRGVRCHVEMRLDRSLCNPEWLSVWPNTCCSILPRLESDHNPLMLSFYKHSFSGPKPFRFNEAWMEHPEFCSIVSSVWNQEVAGCPMKVVVKKLRSFKLKLKDRNYSTFGNVHANVEKAKKEIDGSSSISLSF